MRRAGIAFAVLAALCLSLPQQRAGATSPVHVDSVALFDTNHFDFNNCEGLGDGQTQFSNQVKLIYALVQYSSWNGRHADQFFWYGPDGVLYDKESLRPFNGSGAVVSCNVTTIAGTRRAKLLGVWTLQVRVDGTIVGGDHFLLVDAHAGVTPPLLGSCTSYRNELWTLNQETSRAYDWFNKTLQSFQRGTVSQQGAVFWFRRIQTAIDGGGAGNQAVPGLPQRIAWTSALYGVKAWTKTHDSFSWAALKVSTAASDLETVVSAVAADGVPPNDLSELYGSTYSEGTQNVRYSWDALKQLPCK
jgi:hypothetical protein